jgi:ribonuclease J
MYQWLRPQLLVPVHGETRHLEANGEIARQAGIGNVIIPNTGGVLRLGPGEPQLVGRVRTGHLVPEPVRMGERG